MKAFIVHDGEWIIRTGRCKDADFNAQAGLGQYVIEGEADPTCHKIEDGEVVPYTPPPPDIEPDVRRKRDARLKASDWTQLPDSPLNEAQRAAWAAYRQALRDLPSHVNWPNLDAANWPQVEDL